jgi:hypothetical protein
MRKLAIKKLSDEFGDYLLTIGCRKCRHVRITEPRTLAQIVGWDTPLTTLEKRLRCSSCGGKDCELTANPRPRPRGKEY